MRESTDRFQDNNANGSLRFVKRRAHFGNVSKMPLDFSDDESTSDSSESAAEDLDCTYPSKYKSSNSKGSRHNNKDAEQDSDRRLPLLDIRTIGFGSPDNPIDAQGVYMMGQNMDPSRHLEYYGERLVYDILKERLRYAFKPEAQWTSDLRTRAGLPSWDDENSSPFTLSDPVSSARMAQFLVQLGYVQAISWYTSRPTFHVEIAISGRDKSAPFIWSTKQFRRVSCQSAYEWHR